MLPAYDTRCLCAFNGRFNDDNSNAKISSYIFLAGDALYCFWPTMTPGPAALRIMLPE